jgi:hypothetical protein
MRSFIEYVSENIKDFSINDIMVFGSYRKMKEFDVGDRYFIYDLENTKSEEIKNFLKKYINENFIDKVIKNIKEMINNDKQLKLNKEVYIGIQYPQKK